MPSSYKLFGSLTLFVPADLTLGVLLLFAPADLTLAVGDAAVLFVDDFTLDALLVLFVADFTLAASLVLFVEGASLVLLADATFALAADFAVPSSDDLDIIIIIIPFS